MSAPKGGRQPDQRNFYDDARARLQAEREATRQVTRELHEAVQAAKDAARELRAAQAAVWADTGEMLNDLTREAQLALQELVSRHTAELEQNQARIRDHVEAIEGNIRERFASFAGEYTPGSFRDLLIQQMTLMVNEELHDPVFQQGLAQLMIKLIEATSGGPGSLARAGQMQRKVFRAAAGPIIVQTPDEDHPQVGLYVDGKFVG